MHQYQIDVKIMPNIPVHGKSPVAGSLESYAVVSMNSSLLWFINAVQAWIQLTVIEKELRLNTDDLPFNAQVTKTFGSPEKVSEIISRQPTGHICPGFRIKLERVVLVGGHGLGVGVEQLGDAADAG